MMNCKATEKLLALYAGDDLPARQARRVALHLDSCPKCEKLAGEFGASVALSRSNAAPEFDSNFFDELRRDVLTQITPQPQTPFATFLAHRFAPRRMNYVCGLALICASSLFASYIYFNQLHHTRVPQNVRISIAETLQSTSDIDDSHDLHTAITPKRVGKRRTTTAKASQQVRQIRILTAGSNGIYITPRTIDSESLLVEDLTAMRATKEITLSETVASATVTDDSNSEDRTNNTASVESAVTSAEMLRIEIQTPDPNLRIIWLSPKTENAPPMKTGAHGS